MTHHTKTLAVLLAAATLTGGLAAPAMAADTTTPDTGDQDTTPTPTEGWTLATPKGDVPLSEDSQGELAPAQPVDWGAKPDGKITAVGPDQETVALTPVDTATDATAAYGTATVTGELTGETKKGAVIRVPYTYTEGTPVTGPDDTPITRDGNGDWTLTMSGALDKDNKPPFQEVVLSDGTKLPVTWGAPTLTQTDATGRAWTATGTVADSTNTLGQKLHVTATASRAWDPSLTIGLTRKAGDGATTPISLSDGVIKDVTAVKDGLELTAPTLPHDAMGDAYQPVLTAGNESDVTTDVKASLGDDGERVWTIAIHYTGVDGKDGVKTVTVRQPFDKPAPDTSNPEAALESITVNGETIRDWNPDVRDYTIRAGEHDRVLVKPVAKPGQTVTAGDARQTAYTTVQTWIVSKDGQSRTYTVTLVRDHATPTADEAFTPRDAVDLGGKTEAPSKDTTRVEHVGYSVDGAFTPVDEDSYTIPEGGVFAYQSYAGQTVKVGSGRAHGMTWTYSLGVLAPDGVAYGSHDYQVTYITAATHKAELSAIKTDGKPISGFSPTVTEYTVPVNDPDKYVVTADWDKQSGMAVANHKDGRTVTLTVSSADGLASRTYTVKVVKASTLPDTGVPMLGVAAAGMLTALMAGVAAMLTRRRGVRF